MAKLSKYFKISKQTSSDPVKNEEGPGTSVKNIFCRIFAIEVFLLQYDINWANPQYQTVYFPRYSSYFLAHAKAIDDVMKFNLIKL